jgi:hypothetical protein
MSYKKEAALVHNTSKRTPPHEQTLNRNKRTRHNTTPSTTTWERRSKQVADQGRAQYIFMGIQLNTHYFCKEKFIHIVYSSYIGGKNIS